MVPWWIPPPLSLGGGSTSLGLESDSRQKRPVLCHLKPLFSLNDPSDLHLWRLYPAPVVWRTTRTEITSLRVNSFLRSADVVFRTKGRDPTGSSVKKWKCDQPKPVCVKFKPDKIMAGSPQQLRTNAALTDDDEASICFFLRWFLWVFTESKKTKHGCFLPTITHKDCL